MMLQERQITKNNRPDAEKLIQAITGSTDTPVTFQVFDDSKKGRVKAQVLHGTLDNHWETLCKLNADGAGIFLTINATDGWGRREENITAVQAFWLDLDGAPVEPVSATSPEPHLIVESSPGRFHAYWRVTPILIENGTRPKAKRAFSMIQEGLAARFGGDPSVKDLSRVMRLPGLLHQKGTPFLCRVLKSADHPPYDHAELIKSFAIKGKPTRNSAKTEIGVSPGTITEGDRNEHLFKYACQKVAQGLSEIEVSACVTYENITRCEPQTDDDEVAEIVESAMKYDKEHSLSGKDFDPKVYVAQILMTWNVINLYGAHYRYAKGVYESWSALDIEKTILEWSKGTATVSQMENLVKRLEIETHLEPESVNPQGLLCLRNGILDAETGQIKDHSPHIPFTIQLPVTCLDPPIPQNPREPNCPSFKKFLSEVLPDTGQQDALWEIFGYCLSTDCRYEKGFIFFGDGSNGKTVVLDIMRAMLKGYVSGLRLSDLGHTYRPSMLVDKLVNISAEGEAVELVDDSIVKSVISGEPMPVERKYKDPVYVKPFAKLVIATNHLPRTRDKSFGYFRRWLILHFNQEIAQDRQDKQLAKKIIATELDEIFYGALLGLQRLRTTDGFTVSESSRMTLREYEDQVNPVITFIEENLTDGPSEDKEYLQSIYSQYTHWCKRQGHNPLSQPNLRKEIEKRKGLKAERLTNGRMGFKGLCLAEAWWRPK
jgi:P4 family phage/plasmid primase-like protien